MKNKSNLSFQKYGSSILIFVAGLTAKDAYQKWLSLANLGATSLLNGEEPKFVADKTIQCWSTIAQLQKYCVTMRENELLRQYPDGRIAGVKGSVRAKAAELGVADFSAITTESFRSVNSNFEAYEMGTIIAEKPDDSFSELCVKHAFAN